MAPHALTDHHDSSGYTPSIVNHAKLLPYIQVQSSLQDSTPEPPAPAMRTRLDDPINEEDQCPYAWRLSEEDVKNIEANMRWFQCKLIWF